MPDQARALNAMRMLDLLIQFFGPTGEHWLQGAYSDSNKRRCLVDAIAHLRRKHRISRDGTAFYLNEAIQTERRPPAWSKPAQCSNLMYFNDNRCESFDDLRAVLIKARIGAARDFIHAAVQREIEQQPAFIAAKAAAVQQRQTAAENKRQLLAEIERERIQRHAAGDTRETFILCPRAPEPEPQRLAA
jgi:hypothetical protein